VQSLESLLKAMRREGWRVAVHNDYRLDGKLFTFWLFTHSSGRWVKGEGKTDREAVSLALASAEGRTV